MNQETKNYLKRAEKLEKEWWKKFPPKRPMSQEIEKEVDKQFNEEFYESHNWLEVNDHIKDFVSQDRARIVEILEGMKMKKKRYQNKKGLNLHMSGLSYGDIGYNEAVEQFNQALSQAIKKIKEL